MAGKDPQFWHKERFNIIRHVLAVPTITSRAGVATESGFAVSAVPVTATTATAAHTPHNTRATFQRPVISRLLMSRACRRDDKRPHRQSGEGVA